MTTATARDPRTFNANADWIRALQRTQALANGDTRTLAAVVADRARAASNSPALIGEDLRLTYGELAERVRHYSAWARARELRKGDTVALAMGNHPDYPAIWLGLTGIGVVVALVNTRQVGAALRHSLALANPRHVIADAAAARAIAGLDGAEDWPVWPHGHDGARPRVDGPLGEPADDASPDARAVSPRDLALLIYTSGTTGLPKAARISHSRIRSWSEWFAGAMDAGPGDRLYNCLPMCHSVGGVVAVGAMFACGGATIVRDGFSASRFWPDVAASGATIFQYIGELCRYLVNAPKRGDERAHSLRLCCGNGLRGDVWERFVERFAIPRVIEFYAATEGSFSLFNLEGKPGAIGRVPNFTAHLSPVALVRVDPSTGAPARGDDGLCVRAETGEAGEAIGKVSAAASNLAATFEGYTDARESDGKLLRDVFEKGDAWFRAGDLMRRDRQGFFHFVDRIGDTFRWKGENVSTFEVETALRACDGVLEANVYGVAVPFADGKAGMASIVAAEGFDLGAFRAQAQARLPRYAVPVFLRLRQSLESTGTFKLTKAVDAREGFDPSLVADPLFVEDGGGYRAIDGPLRARIVSGDLRL
jgi:fatty-acyl-CoA synthase